MPNPHAHTHIHAHVRTRTQTRVHMHAFTHKCSFTYMVTCTRVFLTFIAISSNAAYPHFAHEEGIF